MKHEKENFKRHVPIGLNEKGDWMSKRVLKIETKIMMLVVIIVLVSTAILASFATTWTNDNVQVRVEENIRNIAALVSNSEDIAFALSQKDVYGEIQNEVSRYLEAVNDIEFIVVADMDGIRYSHPVEERIGKKFVGGDEAQVIKTGESYISESVGTLGRSIRAFSPIYYDGEQVGFIAVGTLTKSIDQAKRDAFRTIVFLVLLTVFIGIAGAFLLAGNIKKSLLGLEPEEIAKLYTEKAGMLDAMHEGIISVDAEGNVTLVNDSAVNIIGSNQKDASAIIGRNVESVFPTSRLPVVLRTGKAEYDTEQVIGENIILTNRVPIIRDGRILGALATFRDKTEVLKLAEELTGVNQIVEALRANTHEFMNKLHVVLGLIQIKDYEEAEKYIMGITRNQQTLTAGVVKRIQDPTVAGLVLGKISRAGELGVIVQIDERSRLERYHGRIKISSIVKILGNILENAFFAMRDTEENRVVKLYVFENDVSIFMEIEDRGVGIKKDALNKIFEKGYTTKEGSGGEGLFIVRKTVSELGGEIIVDSDPGVGTLFRVTIPKEVDYD
jgi:PAS domain S-box-containing protein